MKFAAWLAANPDRSKGFYDRIKVSKQAFYRYRDGTRIPERDPMIAIYVETGGAVAPNDWYDLPDLTVLTADAPTMVPA